MLQPPNATELYDHRTPMSELADPFGSELFNIAGEPDSAPVLEKLRAELKARFVLSSPAGSA